MSRLFRYELHKQEPSAQRRIMRRYGFIFSQAVEAEPAEPESVPEAEEETLTPGTEVTS